MTDSARLRNPRLGAAAQGPDAGRRTDSEDPYRTAPLDQVLESADQHHDLSSKGLANITQDLVAGILQQVRISYGQACVELMEVPADGPYSFLAAAMTSSLAAA